MSDISADWKYSKASSKLMTGSVLTIAASENIKNKEKLLRLEENKSVMLSTNGAAQYFDG